MRILVVGAGAIGGYFGGRLDAVLERYNVPRIAGPHCYEMYGGAAFDAQMERDPGAFFLTGPRALPLLVACLLGGQLAHLPLLQLAPCAPTRVE